MSECFRDLFRKDDEMVERHDRITLYYKSHKFFWDGVKAIKEACGPGEAKLLLEYLAGGWKPADLAVIRRDARENLVSVISLDDVVTKEIRPRLANAIAMRPGTTKLRPVNEETISDHLTKAILALPVQNAEVMETTLARADARDLAEDGWLDVQGHGFMASEYRRGFRSSCRGPDSFENNFNHDW